MTRIFGNGTAWLKIGFAVAIVAMVTINPAWRAELQAQGYATCGYTAIAWQECGRVEDPGDENPDAHPVGSGIILQWTATCEPVDNWAIYGAPDEVGPCDPDTFVGQSFDIGECHCP
jgi:hypothetical protein